MQTTTTGIVLGTDISTDIETTAGTRMRIIGRVDSGSAGPDSKLMAADTLEGDRVVSLSREDLGRVTDIMLDVQHGRIAYTVMPVGGFLSIGNRLFAVLWSTMSLDVDRECFVLDTSRDCLEVAPGFDKDSWSTTAGPTQAQSVHEYRGSRPYWEEY